MTKWSELEFALKEQKRFSDNFFDVEELSDSQKQEMLKTFALSLHSEATGIADAVNYKDHRMIEHPIDTQRILYKSVDVYRYVLAIMNLWGISVSSFASALEQKDDYLHYRHGLSSKKWQSGQPVALFDLDDVIAEFRASFCTFVTQDSGVFIDPEDVEYYSASTFKSNGLDNEGYLKKFVEAHGLLTLGVNDTYMNFMRRLREDGFWIQIVTARHDSNLTVLYDTYSWLRRKEIPADGVAFTPEKFLWLSRQNFYKEHAKVIAIDDSAKHSAEYVKHGVTTIVPQKPYNTEVSSLAGAVYVPSGIKPYDFVRTAGVI